MSDTVVFIPAWNEEQNLPAVLEELQRELPDADVLVVDDGSTDRTAEVARAHGAEVLSFGENRGLRAGIAAGYTWALEHDYAFCGRVDADGQHPAAELRRLLELVQSGKTDVAVGSRFVSGPGYEPYRYEPEGIRKLGTGLLRRSMKVALGRPFNDATSGLYAASAKALPALSRPYESGAPEVEAVLRLHDEGLRVEEVPVDMRERASGESKLKGKKAFLLVVTVIVTLLGAKRLPEAVTRLVAVLGYSTGRHDGLHPICAARLQAAERPAEEADLVLLSGWSRRRHRPSEAELMKAAWRGPAVRLVADGDARTTAGNARSVAAAARHIGADEVVLVTSSWHARRARLLVAAALDPEVRLTVATPGRTRPPHLIGRELAWLPVSLVSRTLARRRR